MTGVLPLVSKTAKVVPVSKKDSKLNCKKYALHLITSHTLIDITENLNIGCGVLKTYQYASINDFDSGLVAIICGIHQRSVLGVFSFLLTTLSKR